MDQSRSEVPFLKAGPRGAVRPKEESREEQASSQNDGTSARTVASLRSRFREAVVLPELLRTLDVAQERGDIRPLDTRLRSAEQYYGPTDVEDGLRQDGGPDTGTVPDRTPVEEEEGGATLHSRSR